MSGQKETDENIFHLIYVSTATQSLDVGDIRDIENTSVTNNNRIDVTGILLYRQGKFMQVLEGSESEVRKLFSAISKDRRHKDVTVIREGVIPNRQFSGWSMRYTPLADIQSYGGLIHKKLFDMTSTAKEVIKSAEEMMHLLLKFKEPHFAYFHN